jgi:hypothetical protein
MNNAPNMQTQTPLNKTFGSARPQKPIPKKLYEVDDGKIAKLVEYMRDNSKNISPEEMRLRLNPEEITGAAEMQFSSKARKWESFRNIVLFLPLILTWFSFGLASDAFKLSATNAKNVGQSFFALWINGFPTLSSLPFNLGPWYIDLPYSWHWFSFGGVALTDFVLLTAIMFINQKAHKADVVARKQATEVGAWLRTELEELSQQSLVRSLGVGPDSKQPQWAVEVHTAINSLHSVLDNVKVAVGVSQNSFAETIDRFADTYQQQSLSVDGLIQNTRDIEVAITQLLAMKDIYVRLESILPQMGRHFEIMAQQEARATQALASIATEITNASQAIVAIARPFQAMGMHQVAQQVADQQRNNLATLIQMESRLRDMDNRIAHKMKQKGSGIFSPLRSLQKRFKSDHSQDTSQGG